VGKAMLDATLPATEIFLTRFGDGVTLWLNRTSQERVELLKDHALSILELRFDEANVQAVRGLLAVESGDPERASAAFKEVQQLLAPLESYRGRPIRRSPRTSPNSSSASWAAS
jgi:hypothetical protein